MAVIMDLEKLKQLNVLYIEDELDLQEVTCSFLVDFIGNIVVANNGEDALSKFEDNKFDLIITDINMPKLNGVDMMRQMRQIQPNLKIIVTTAYNHEEKLKELSDAGMNEYIMKPIDFTKLVETILKITD